MDWIVFPWIIFSTYIPADKFFPNFTIRTLEPELEDATDLKAAVVDVARRAIEAEQEHLESAVDVIIERATEALEKQIAEREDILDMFFQGLGDEEDARKPQQILEELQSNLRVNVKLNSAAEFDTMEKELDEKIERIVKEMKLK